MGNNSRLREMLDELERLIDQEGRPGELRCQAARLEQANAEWKERLGQQAAEFGSVVTELDLWPHDPMATRTLQLLANGSAITKIVMRGGQFNPSRLTLLKGFARLNSLEISGFVDEQEAAAEALRGLELTDVVFDAGFFTDRLMAVLSRMPLETLVCQCHGTYRGMNENTGVPLSRSNAVTLAGMKLKTLGLRGFNFENDVWETLAIGAQQHATLWLRSSHLTPAGIEALEALKPVRLLIKREAWQVGDDHYRKLLGDRLQNCQLEFN